MFEEDYELPPNTCVECNTDKLFDVPIYLYGYVRVFDCGCTWNQHRTENWHHQGVQALVEENFEI